MRKFLTIMALIATFSSAAWAGVYKNITWIDDLSGFTLIGYEDGTDEASRTYRLSSPQENYDRLVQLLKNKGWKVIKSKYNDDAPGMPELKMSNGQHKLEIEVDDIDDQPGAYKLEVEIEPLPQY